MQGRTFKDAVFRLFARVARSFSAPKRLELLDVLAQGERDVETLACETGCSVANASRHLQVLRQTGLVASRREGVRVVYRLSGPEVERAWHGLRSLSESRLAGLPDAARDYFAGRDGLEPLERDELLRRVRQGDAVVLDVRPSQEFEAGHIAGALSMPLSTLRRRLDLLPSDREIVAYCRGPYCVLAAEAVALLRRSGRRAVRLREGFPEWRGAGLPVATGAEPGRTS